MINKYRNVIKGSVIFLMGSLLFGGCASSKTNPGNRSMQVLETTYHHWSEPPPPGSDVPERGTDLTIVVQDWPEDFTLHHVIYNQHKSLSAVVEDRTQNTVTITARIIRMSGALAERSDPITQSDRVVYKQPNGEFGFIPITSWERK